MKKGIDVSQWQGSINWDAVKADGIEFAILRCGFGSDFGSDIKDQDDVCFIRNAKECERVGIPYGVYLYSYANTIKKAESEAQHVLRLLKGLKPEYPIYYDLEEQTVAAQGNEFILNASKKFVSILEEAGYWVGIYANLYWNETFLTDKWYDTKARWVAQYNKECEYKGEYGIWQYSSLGKVNGINGDVDLNYAYVDYPKLIKEAGKNGFDKKANVTTSPTYDIKTFIKDIQKAFGATVDGIAGPETLSKTITLSSEVNFKHPSIKHVQNRLRELGYVEVGKADGIAGPKFTSAVAHFQQNNGCVVDGVISARNKTWKKLLGLL